MWIKQLVSQLQENEITQQLAYLVSHPLCSSAVNEKGTISKTTISNRIKEIRRTTPVKADYTDDYEELVKALAWAEKAEALSKEIKDKSADLDRRVREKYADLTEKEVKNLLINLKWYASIQSGIHELYVSASQALTARLTELGKRYESTLSELTDETALYESRVKSHLERMGFVW